MFVRKSLDHEPLPHDLVKPPSECEEITRYKSPLTVKVLGILVTGVHLAPGAPDPTRSCKRATLQAIREMHKAKGMPGVIAGDYNWFWQYETEGKSLVDELSDDGVKDAFEVGV